MSFFLSIRKYYLRDINTSITFFTTYLLYIGILFGLLGALPLFLLTFSFVTILFYENLFYKKCKFDGDNISEIFAVILGGLIGLVIH